MLSNLADTAGANSTAFDRDEIEGSILQRFAKQVQAHAGKLALKDGARQYTYRELDEEATRIAGAILDSNDEASVQVALLCELSADAVIFHLGALKAGKACVVLDPSSPLKRLREIVAHSQADIVVTKSPHMTLAGALGARYIIDVDAIEPSSGVLFDTIAAGPDSPAALLYTSGSMGQAKAVLLTHRAVLHRAWSDLLFEKITPADRQSLLVFSGFSAGFADLLTPLLTGASVHPFDLRKRELSRLADWIVEDQISILHPPVSAFRQLLHTLAPDRRFPGCRLVVLGGEATFRSDVEAIRRHFGNDCMVISQLASTETMVISRFRVSAGTELDSPIVPVGYPDEDKDVRILDSDGSELGPGETGEIVVGSRYLASGYWRLQDRTRKNFESAGDSQRFHTGTLGMRRPDGCVECFGRIDSVVKLRGYRIDLTEIEAALLDTGLFLAAAVAIVELRPGLRQVVAYALPGAPPGPKVAELRLLLAQSLPRYMLPSRFVFLDDIPHTPTGKLDRAALPHPGSPETDRSWSRGPETEMERLLVEIWQHVLEIDDIGTDEDFFAIGGDSLSAVRIATELEHATGRSVPAGCLVQAPTISALAASLGKDLQPAPAVPLNPTPAGSHASSRRPLFCIYGLYLYKRLADALGAEFPVYGIYMPIEFELLQPADSMKGRLGRARVMPSTEALAASYIDQIRGVQRVGPYQLFGASFGGTVAFEMARQLRSAGEAVSLLAMLDSFAPGSRRPNSLRGLLDQLRLTLETRKPLPVPKRGNLSNDFWEMLRARIRRGAARKYRGYPYCGPAILFRAEQQIAFPGYRQDPRLGWDAWVQGGLTVESVPGRHIEILQNKDVSVLADRLRRYLVAGAADES